MNLDDDYSDLTDLDSADEYNEKPKKKTAQKNPKDGAYKIKNALKVPRATTYTAQALYDQIHSCDINLEPEYQRDVVWPETKQIGIIDSVFRNFYIPPVIFAVNTSDDGYETRTCIDGKQRLTSIQRFMDGFIPHKDPLTGERLWYKEVPSGKSARARKLLPERYRRVFANKQIVCVEYHDITDTDEREIFQRVQLGMALTPAEKLQVISTSRAAFIRELQAKHLKEDGALAGEALEWDRSRGGDFRCLAQAVYCMESYGLSLKNAGTIVKLEKWLSEAVQFSDSFRGKVQDTFQVFSELVLDNNVNKVFKSPAKVSPIEFVMISLLVAVHKDRMSRAQLAGAIGDMRSDVRDTHVDIRMNDRVAKTMLDFIRNAKGKVVHEGGITGSGSGSGSGEKRKRTSASDEGDAVPRVKKATPIPPRDNVARTASTSSFSSNTARTSAVPARTLTASTSSFSSSTTTVPDRMAALRAAKLATRTSTQNLDLNHNQQSPLTSQSQPQPSLQPNGMNLSIPQLPSPGQTFTFLSSQNSPYQHSQHQLPAPVPLQPPVTSIDMSLMAQMMRSNTTVAAAAKPNLSINTNGSTSHRPSFPPRPASSDRDRDRDNRDRDRDHIPSRPHHHDEDYYSRDRHRMPSGSSSGVSGRGSGWGTRGR